MAVTGKIVKVWGNRGELLCWFSSCLSDYKALIGRTAYLRSDRYEKTRNIALIRPMKDRFLMKFAGIDSIEKAYPLVGYEISIPAGEPNMSEEHPAQYRGYTVQDVNGVYWGEVVETETRSANPLLEISDGEQIVLIPFVDEIVLSINRKSRIITVDPPEGLRELNQ